MSLEKLPISAVLITLNAGSQLDVALNSLHFCSELLVVDSGSTDETRAIAATHGARFVHQDWLGFGPQKQFAVGLAKFDWVLCLDADEEISPALAHSIRLALNNPSTLPSNLAGYALPRCNFFLGRYLRHGEGYPDLNPRLFHTQRAQWSSDPVHEKVQAQPNMLFQQLTGDILHHSAETLHHYLDKQNRYTSIQAEQMVLRGRTPSFAKLVLSPLVRFIKFYVLRQGFRDGWQGFVHIAIGCFYSLVKYSKAKALLEQKRAQAIRNRETNSAR